MKRKRMSKVRFKIHENGTVTLSGLHYQDLRSIICNASIDIYNSLDDARDENNQTHVEYYLYMRNLINYVNDSINDGISETFPREERKPTKKERWKAVREQRKERILFDEIFHQMIVEAQKCNNANS